MTRGPVLIADDHPLFVSALTMAVRAVDPAVAIETAATLADAERLVSARRHSLVLLDLLLPDVHGFAGLALLRALEPDTPIAIVTGRDEAAVALRAMTLGARGFIGKGAPMDRIVAAIRVLLAGGQWFPDVVAAGHAGEGAGEGNTALARVAELSVAQLKVLRRMADGLQNKQIAHELGVAEPTVKTHLVAVFKKLGVTNRTQAVLALRAADGAPEDQRAPS